MSGTSGISTSWIGIDESGKGDYFGPLVVAGVFLRENQVRELLDLGVRDSKRLSDRKGIQLARALSSRVLFSTVVIGPRRYNELYEKIRNLNRLLAWGHARVLENLLERTDCPRAISDQFGNEHFILNSLMEKGRQIKLEQRPRAESDPAVAAASILARAEFLKRLEELSRKTGMTLPKGASEQVQVTAREVVRRKGQEALRDLVKWHFKTTRQVLSASGH